MSLQNYSNKIILYTCLLLTAVGFWTCYGDANSKDDILVSFGMANLTRSEVDSFIPSGISIEDSATYANDYINQWISNQAVASSAREAISDIDEKIKYRLKNYENRLLEQVYMEWLAEPPRMNTHISENDIRVYYARFPNKFISRSKQYQYFHVKSAVQERYQTTTWMRSSDESVLSTLKEWAKENAVEYKLDSTYRSESEVLRVGKGWPYVDIRRSTFGVVTPYSYMENDTTYYHYFKMINVIDSGDKLPLSMVREEIRTLLLAKRKNEMIDRTIQRITDQAMRGSKLRDNRSE